MTGTIANSLEEESEDGEEDREDDDDDEKRVVRHEADDEPDPAVTRFALAMTIQSQSQSVHRGMSMFVGRERATPRVIIVIARLGKYRSRPRDLDRVEKG